MINSARDTLVNSRHFSLPSFFSLQACKFVVHKKLWRERSEKSPLLPVRTTNESILINHPLCMILIVWVQGKVHKNVCVLKEDALVWVVSNVTGTVIDDGKARGKDWVLLPVPILPLCYWSSWFFICARRCQYHCVFISLLYPFWNHWWYLQSDWLSEVWFVHELHHFLF